VSWDWSGRPPVHARDSARALAWHSGESSAIAVCNRNTQGRSDILSSCSNGRIARGLALEEIRWDVILASRFLLHLLSAATRISPGRSESLEVARVLKGKSVSGEALLWGDPSHRVADMRRKCRKTSKGKKSSQGDFFFWGGLGGIFASCAAAARVSFPDIRVAGMPTMGALSGGFL